MPVIYIDVLFAVNFLVNYLLLRVCCIFSGLKVYKYRIISGSIIGACYAVLVFFPDFTLIHSTVYKLLISMLIIAASSPFFSVRSYLKTLLIFYAVSFAFGGCVLGIFYFSNVGARLGAVYSNGILYFNLPWTILALSGAVFYTSVKLFTIITKRNIQGKNLKKKILLYFKENFVEVTALMDTGNSLVDPISLSPVIIVEYKLLKNLFSKDVREDLDRIGNENIEWIMKDVTHKGLPVRLIPFASLGKENGLLLGFVPDKIEIYDNCGVRIIDKCVVGIYERQLSKDKSFGALLNPYL